MDDRDDSLSPTEALGFVLDQHLRWIGAWHRAVFYGQEDTDLAAAPATFAAWIAMVARSELANQPVVEKLATLHEQMHRQAKLLALKAGSGDAPSADEYEGVMGRFDAFCAQLRRVERAFGAAASGLDPLTGLHTRRGMNEALANEMNRYRRTGQSFCLALCDLDHFKAVNDTHGHETGDRVLSVFAAVVSRTVRSFDEAFRMGGEEFLICLKDTGLDGAYTVVERLRQDVMNEIIPAADGSPIRVTASFGLVQSDAAPSIEELVVLADKALYRAKAAGRNRIVRYGVRPRAAAPEAPAAPRRTIKQD
jgi:diguanylate cyclase